MWLKPVPSCFSMLKPYCSATPPPPTTLKSITAMKTTEEPDVGIFCYISQLPGFRGILKQRYSDFMVNEVDTEGNVVHLTNLDAPAETVKEIETKTHDVTSKDYTTEIESFRSLVDPDDVERLEAIINQINSGSEDSILPIVLSPDYDKSHRTAVHNFFKENFKFLVTDTVDGPDASSKCIRVRINSGGQNSRGRNSRKRKERGDKPFDSRGSDDWSENVGKFLRFHLYKENKDTQEALGIIAKMLGIQPRSFGFAGTKDKRAVTTQRLCEGRTCPRPTLGKPIYNYIERFGSGSVPTHLIGATLLRGEWKSTAREYYKETNDIEGTLRQLPRHLVSEKAILQCLKKCPGNYLQALKAIPRTLRMMYVHSYQSYLWNHAASMRVQKYGTDRVVLGDLVYCKGNETEKVSEVVSSKCVDENGNDTLDPNDLDDISGTNLPEESLNLVKAVTAEDILSGNYTIDDVVLPMPGSRVIFPENDIAHVFHDLAKKDAISLTESVHNVKEILKYIDGNKPLVDTDFDKIAKTKPSSLNEDGRLHDKTKQSECLDNDIGLQTDDNGAKAKGEELPQAESLYDTNPQETQTALKLSFILPASCYATMAIRELLKTSTSVAFHKTLN
ncbi:Pseudouridine synthase family protein [Prunus dulcis]|uniref:Pseudouridine synthase family protein n=1 Tax=Prunus dulcis TaxID=3755 RepID=A0A4Y1RQY8_PRUDU|nr:Pseudouridine synthase family protein [Prunus dulcis]